MKLTKETLKRIIKEELEAVMGENDSALEAKEAAQELQSSREAEKLLRYARVNDSNRARQAFSDIYSYVNDPGPGSRETLEKMQSRNYDPIAGLDDELIDLIVNYASRATQILDKQGEARGAKNRASAKTRARRNVLYKFKDPVIEVMLKHERTASLMKYPNGTALEQLYNELLAENPVKIFEPAPAPANTFDELVVQAAMEAMMLDSYDDAMEIKKNLARVKKDPDLYESAAYKIIQNTSKLIGKKRSFMQKAGSFIKGKGFREE